MKIRIKLIILVGAFFFSTLQGCKDFLNIVPDNIATVEMAFRNRSDAERYLFTCYSYWPVIKSVYSNPALMAGDEAWVYDNFRYDFNYSLLIDIPMGLQQVSNPYANYWNGSKGGKNLWQGIRDCNIFIEGIKTSVDVSDEEKARWTAEVKFLKAYYHFFLLRMYGPIPIVRENLPVSANVSEVKIFREPVAECIDYIVELLDEAIPDLLLIIEDRANEMGRITKPAALTMKADVLATAASPLFNGNADYASFTDSRSVPLFPIEYSQEKWQLAVQACADAIASCHEAGIRLIKKEDIINQQFDLPEELKQVLIPRYTVTEKWNPEQIWSVTSSLGGGYYDAMCIPALDLGEESNTSSDFTPRHAYAPTLRVAEMFYSKNGIPIEEDLSWPYANRYDTQIVDSTHRYVLHEGYEASKLCFDREARFYGSVALDGSNWYGYSQTNPEELLYVQAKARQISGFGSRTRPNGTGIFCKKVVHFDATAKSDNRVSLPRYPFPLYRLSDLYLLYSECLNEVKDTPDNDVYQWIDAVRDHAGLNGVKDSWQNHSSNPAKPLTKDGFREIIKQERMIELAFEGKRYWDLRRWKDLHRNLNQPIRGFSTKAEDTESFNIPRQIFNPQFSSRDYLYPIKESLILENPNLVQNPGW